jgi:protein LSM14
MQIRYEGILTGVSTDESTITLTNVRSYGTEDRETSNVIGPSGSIYEYIIFHAGDIKEIEVCEPVGSINDPLYLRQAYLYLKRYPQNANQTINRSSDDNLHQTIYVNGPPEDRMNEGSTLCQVIEISSEKSESTTPNKQDLSKASNTIPRPALINNSINRTDPVIRNKKPNQPADKMQTYQINSTTQESLSSQNSSSKMRGGRTKPTYRVKGTDLPNSETTNINISPNDTELTPTNSPDSTPKSAHKKRPQKVFRPKQRNDSTDNPGEIGTSSDM